MRVLSSLLVVTGLLALAPARPATAAEVGGPPVGALRFERPRVLVWQLVADGVPEQDARLVAASVTRWAGRNPHLEVIAASEVQSLLDVEAARQATGLPDEGRLAQVAKAVNASLVLFGQVGKGVGGHVVHLQLFRADQARAVGREQAVVADLARVDEALGRAATVLVGRVFELPAPDVRTAARHLVDTLGEDLFVATPGEVLPMPPFTWTGSDFSAPFGERVAAEVAGALRARGGKRPYRLQEGLALRGTFHPNADMVEVALVVWDTRSQKIIARSQVRLIRYGVAAASLIPSSLAAEARLRAEEEAGLHGPGLRLDAWTEKGRYDVAFVEGETFHVYLKMNRAGFVRLLYHLDSETVVLMEDALPVSDDRVGEVIRYHQEFGPAPPFGVERIEAIGYAKRPAPLITLKRVIAGSEYDVVSTRGFVVDPEAHVNISITTSAR